MSKWNEPEKDMVKEKFESLGEDIVQEGRRLGAVIGEIILNTRERAKQAEALAARRLELLREAKVAIKHGYYSRTLLERIIEELGDD